MRPKLADKCVSKECTYVLLVIVVEYRLIHAHPLVVEDTIYLGCGPIWLLCLGLSFGRI